MANDFIYSFQETETKSKFKKLYNLLKDELNRRAMPSSINDSRLSQFVNTTYNNLPSISEKDDIIDYDLIHYTMNRLRNAINGKSISNSPYTDTNLIIKDSDIDADISYVNTLAGITDNTSTNHKCNAVCIGLCKGACYGSCNGCSGCSGTRG